MTIGTHRVGPLAAAVSVRRIMLISALALASMLASAIAPPAQAQAAIACPSARICLYEHSNYGGRMAYYATGSSNMAIYGPSFNDMTSSIRNNTPYRWCVYQHANYGGAVRYVSPLSSYPTLDGGWNDIISSLRKC